MKAKQPLSKSKHPLPKDYALTDMRKFFASINWIEWWEEYYYDLDQSGRWKYKSVDQFAAAHAKNSEQRSFIKYYLGPEDEGDKRAEKWPFIKPQDWKKKRETGGWYTEENITRFKKAITVRMNALEALREAGHGITLNSLVRAEQLAQRLDKEYQGRFFVDGLSYKENVQRAGDYLELHRKILQMKAVAQDLYAKSHGINMDMDGFANLIAASAMAVQAGANVANQKTSAEKAVEELVKLTMVKASRYNLPLPKDAEDTIIDVASQPVQEEKKKVN